MACTERGRRAREMEREIDRNRTRGRKLKRKIEMDKAQKIVVRGTME